MVKVFSQKSMILVFVKGNDPQGKPIYVRKTFKNLTEASTETQIIAVGNALAALYDLSFSHIEVDEDHALRAE